MNDSTDNNADRRAYFRINDRLLIDIKILEPEAAWELGKLIVNSAPHASHPNQQLLSLEAAFHHLTDQIGHADRDVARALRMLDEKINLLANNVQHLLQPIDDTQAQAVNLSAGGISILSDQVIAPKTPVAVNLTLLPSGLSIRAVAKVISCEQLLSAQNGKGFSLRLAFTHMNENDRNILVRHTLTRQAENLRQQKQQS
ncbi:MAG: PilZ domain-containing protein [Methylophaga sp.]|nr:PilZ domain-containing protein [Methylophaga sp.]